MKKESNIYILMVLCAFFWAGAFIAGKIGIKEFPPFSLAFFRFLFATLLIIPVMMRYEKKDWRLKKEDFKVVLALGIIGMFGYHVLFFMALQYTTAINSSMIAATNPMITSIIASWIIGERLGIKRIGAISIAFAGVVLTLTNGSISTLSNMNFNVGDVIMLLAVVCWATYGVISKKVMHRYSPLILTSYSFLVCLVALVPFVIFEKPLEYLPNVTMAGWGSVIYMAIFASFIGYLVQQVAIKAIGPSKTSVFINLVPVFSIALSSIILKENVTMIKCVSAMIIIFGVYVNSKINIQTTK